MFLLTFLTWGVILEFQATALDVSVKGDICHKQDLCKQKISSKFRTCHCDDDCDHFGTCCVDADNFPRMIHSVPEYQCHAERTSRPVYAKRSCSKSFKGHVSRTLACLESEDDQADVIATSPVTSSRTGITYWNIDCGVCSEEDYGDLVQWPVQVTCTTPNTDGNYDEEYIRNQLTFNKDLSKWGLQSEDGFRECLINYMEPNVTHEVFESKRYCPKSMISNCPSNYLDTDTAAKCSLFYGERKRKNSNQFYRNVFCALCNGVPLKQLECIGESYENEVYNNSSDVEALFDSGQWLDREAGQKWKCSGGFTYDPFWKRCRRSVGSHSQLTSDSVKVVVSVTFTIYLFAILKLTIF